MEDKKEAGAESLMEGNEGEAAGKCIDVSGDVNGGLARHPVGLTASCLLLMVFLLLREAGA